MKVAPGPRPARAKPRYTSAPAFTAPAALPSARTRARPPAAVRSRMAPRSLSRDNVAVYLVTDRRHNPLLTIPEIVEAAVRGDGGAHRATVVQ